MDEYAGVYITVCVDVEIIVSAGNASADIFCIVLEVHGKEGLLRAIFADTPVDKFSLFRCGKEFGSRIIAYGHIVEIPDKVGTPRR